MRKTLKSLLAGAMILSLTACGNSAPKGSDTLKGTYSINITGEDYGCGVDKAIIKLDNVVDAVGPETFTVTEVKQDTDWTSADFPIVDVTNQRTILDAYLSDETGNKVSEASQFVTIELGISPIEGSPFVYAMATGYNSWTQPYELHIALTEGTTLTSQGTTVTTFEVDPVYTSRTTSADMFKQETGTYGNYNYNYATYTPQTPSKTVFVWLNGAGEGGSDVLGETTNVEVTLLANKVTALAGEDFQTTLGGCNVLVPQCPTFWMDNGNGEYYYGKECIYTDSLIALIDDYVEKNGIEKVIVGGCSNGGYMTEVVALNAKDKYDAYVPICACVGNDSLTDDDIKTLASLPLYFVYSEDDDDVVPSIYELPLLAKLREAGAENLHVSHTEHVVDTSGLYNYLNDGQPYQYAGHWSWIYFDNDQTACEDCNISAFDWLAETLK